ncbi:glycoside hydrolase family 43 protein [Tessaracoccus sp. HDW20]|nr:hypothetical protein [Tessaracoccus coleopterorum]NHB85591.1 glycoside hydrolase family 43 protein [Tessaracoccus coleopterorum]
MSAIVPTGSTLGYLGRSLYNGDALFTGDVTDVKFWDESLTVAQVIASIPDAGEKAASSDALVRLDLEPLLLADNRSLDDVRSDLFLPAPSPASPSPGRRPTPRSSRTPARSPARPPMRPSSSPRCWIVGPWCPSPSTSRPPAPSITSTVDAKGLRDPYILRSAQGDKYYMVATDLCIGCGTVTFTGEGWSATVGLVDGVATVEVPTGVPGSPRPTTATATPLSPPRSPTVSRSEAGGVDGGRREPLRGGKGRPDRLGDRRRGRHRREDRVGPRLQDDRLDRGGRRASTSFSSRLTEVPAGQVVVTATQDGAPVSVTVEAPGSSC